MKTIVVVTRNVVFASIAENILKDLFHVVVFTNIQSSLDYIYNSLPDLLCVEITPDDTLTTRVLNDLKSDPIFGQVTVLAVFPDDMPMPQWDSLIVEDYIRSSRLEDEMLPKVRLCIKRAERVVEVNPLTRLPGNTTIIRQIKKRIEKHEFFALAYADLDYFKPFNDAYGFGRGDEVLKMLGRLILNTVKNKQPHNSFVGHIGGDDFVFIMEPETVEEAAREVIENFDKIIPTFYDQADRARGYMESADREGRRRTYPVMSISIGIASNRLVSFSHYGEVTELASEMKKFAKFTEGSCYKMDRRQYAPSA